MKCTVARKSSLNKGERYEIISDSKIFCSGKAKPSKEFKGQYRVKISNPMDKYIEKDSCFIEPNPAQPRSYSIYFQNHKTQEKSLFGQLHYILCGYNNYLYTIIIGQKLYRVRSYDLISRHLTIMNEIQLNNSSSANSPSTLLQLNNTFSKLNKHYHAIINDKQFQYGYLAFIILFDLHECKRK